MVEAGEKVSTERVPFEMKSAPGEKNSTDDDDEEEEEESEDEELKRQWNLRSVG